MSASFQQANKTTIAGATRCRAAIPCTSLARETTRLRDYQEALTALEAMDKKKSAIAREEQ